MTGPDLEQVLRDGIQSAGRDMVDVVLLALETTFEIQPVFAINADFTAGYNLAVSCIREFRKSLP